MSPRKPAALRDGDGQNLHDYLITTAARLIDQRGSAGLAVRDIAREAQVADGVLYNYFADKEDLLAQALLAHVAAVMSSAPQLPPAGTGMVAENLALFIDLGLAVLVRVTPAFAGLLSQPKVLNRFHAMVGGDAAFGAAAAGDDSDAASGAAGTGDAAAGAAAEATIGAGDDADAGRPSGQETGSGGGGGRGLPDTLKAYLRAEQRLGRIDAAADVDSASVLIIGAIHGEVLPRVLFNPPGTAITTPPGFARGLAETVLSGIAPGSRRP